MSTILTFLAMLGVGILFFKAGQSWEKGRPPTPAERQEQLARHVVEPVQQTGALVITDLDWQNAERILREALG